MRVFVTGATGFIGSAVVPELINAGQMGAAAPGQPANEYFFNANHPHPRSASELTGAALSDSGVNVSVVRLPQVHDTVKQGLITYAIALARDKGVSAYVGDGSNRWPAAHVFDVARLYRLVLEKQQAGSRYHAVAEEGVPVRAIAEVIGRGLSVPVVAMSPEEAAAHFGWLAMFAGMDLPASAAQTRERLQWNPTGPGLIVDLEQMHWRNA
jgi:nucleoside-diphosphate-sugar epimerase